MTQALVTVIVPFAAALAKAVDDELDALGNPAPANSDVAKKLKASGFVHFMSMIVVPPRERERIAHLVLEVCADGHAPAVLARLVRCIPDTLSKVLKAVGHTKSREQLGPFLESCRWDPGIGWPALAGVSFSGTPGMSLERINSENTLAKTIRELLDGDSTPRPALEKLAAIRKVIFEDANLKWAFLSEPTPSLGEAKPLLDSWWPLLKAAFRDFFWPLALPPTVVLLYSRLVWWSGLAIAAWHVVLAVLIELAAVGALIAIGHRVLRRQEKADTPSEEEPTEAHMDEILKCEDHSRIAQNHLAGVSILKPGWVRRVTLRIALWLIGELEIRRSRPGYLNRIGSIHFARWFCLPGTDQLVFLSNYDGSWQSYLEDFIGRVREGLTTVWSNTRDFPKTENLYLGGAGDSTRFKRWARRQQLPTRFWYTAYPELTTARIRTNAEIRRGLVSASSESEAAQWLALFGYPQPETLETQEIPILAFTGLMPLRFSHCLLGCLGDDRDKARAWLRGIERDLSYGEYPGGAPQAGDFYLTKAPPVQPGNHALAVGFTHSGLSVLLDSSDPGLATFPIPFQQGMAKRSRALGDVGQDAPEEWKWGGSKENRDRAEPKRVDVLLMLYARSKPELLDQLADRRNELSALGGAPLEIALTALPEKDPGKKRPDLREPFGFRDAISQPVMRGTRRWSRTESANHSVEPGELVLGYRDNLGNRSPVPRCNGQDIGRNSTFLVVRQIEQDKDELERYVTGAASALASDPRVPKRSPTQLAEWVKAKMVGRWPDGTSLVKYPDRPGTEDDPHVEPDNAFLFGREDPDGLRCPLGAHVRRANPRDSFEPGSQVQLGITNRHRILRVGRAYEPAEKDDKPGLLFMCVNADIERQFEFLQQTWLLGPNFDGLNNEIDPVVGHRSNKDSMTIPTPGGPLRLPGLQKFVTIRGGGYFFMPGKSAVRVLAG